MNEHRMIVISYYGSPSPEMIEYLSEVIATREPRIENVEIFDYNASDVAKIVSKDALEKSSTKPPYGVVCDDLTPEDHAVVYIGTIMRNELANYNTNNFISSLITRINEASVHPENEDSRKFMNALFILSKEHLIVSRRVLAKYHMTQQKLDVIRRTYHFSSSF
jgi:hypothetical protein